MALEVAAGNLDARATVWAKDEIGEVALAINTMTDHLLHTQDDLAQTNRRLAATNRIMMAAGLKRVRNIMSNNLDEKQIEQLETAVATVREKEDVIELINALTQLGQAQLAAGNVPKALTQFEEGLELAQSAGDKLLEGRLWGYRGICLMRLGNSHFAQIALYKSHNLAKELDNKPLLIDALIQMGTLQMDSGQSAKAISKLEQAMGLALSINDQPRTMHLAGKLGNLFLSLSSLEKAVEYFSLALQAANELDQQYAACSYKLSIGQAYLTNEQYDTARELFEEALALASELESPPAEMSALSSLMHTHIGIGSR